MKLTIRNANPGRHVGYGEVCYYMAKTLTSLGHSIVPYMEAKVKLWYCWPRKNRVADPGYHIAYLPWESTKLKTAWHHLLNNHAEVWTPSPVIAEWFAAEGVTVPIYVYQHGVGEEWIPRQRRTDGPIRFFHHGGDALRKGGQQAMQAFNAAFPNDKDVSLTLKMYSQGWDIPSIGRVQIINETLSLPDLVQMYYDHDVMVCNSWGEGFGLPGLQGMASGMPLICTEGWAPYKDYLRMPVSAVLEESPWQEYHPGKLWKPDFDELVDQYRYARDNFEKESVAALEMAPEIRKEYSWENQTLSVFKELETRLPN